MAARRHVDLLGALAPDGRIAEWWTSAPCAVPLFDATPLPFTITVEDDAAWERDLPDAIRAFLALGPGDRTALSERVVACYEAMLDVVDIEPLPLGSPSDIWRFVTPTEILVHRRDRRDRDIYVVALCDCEWEPEHGLQLVFRRGHLPVRVSEQDGHLTQADSRDIPDEQDEWLTHLKVC